MILGGLVGLFLLELLVVGLWPGFKAPTQPLDPGLRAVDDEPGPPIGPERAVSFPVGGVTLRGLFYLPPDTTRPVPCVVMAHGAGGVMAMGLARYARRFQAAGLAVLAFDYRHWGESDGQPRHLLRIPSQLADWAAALAYARNLKEVDPERIALWGTSLSGGHVITTAARDGRVACVCAQCPGLDGRATAEVIRHREGLGHALRLVAHGQRDLVRSWLGLSPHMIPVVGRHGALALMPMDQAYQDFGRMAPPGYLNQACARILVRGDKYRPVRYASRVRCPTLLQICEHDEFTPGGRGPKNGVGAGRPGRGEALPHKPFRHLFRPAFRDQPGRSSGVPDPPSGPVGRRPHPLTTGRGRSVSTLFPLT